MKNLNQIESEILDKVKNVSDRKSFDLFKTEIFGKKGIITELFKTIGKLDQSEIPEKCALRELEEELGYRANKLTFLANIHPAVGFTDEKMWLYLAEGLVKTKQNLDADEFLEIIPTKLNEAVDLVWSGKITDVKTIIGILWAQRTLSNDI